MRGIEALLGLIHWILEPKMAVFHTFDLKNNPIEPVIIFIIQRQWLYF